jgi:AcrR family transcriptional regulator
MTKSYHHGNLREALVEAAIPVLRNKGIVGLSLRELATSLGVSHGAPYRHFRNKAALLEAIATAGFEALRDICRQAATDFPQDPRRQLYEAGIGYVFYVSQNTEIADLMFRPTLPNREHCEALQHAANEAISGLTAIIEGGKRAGVFIQRDTDDLVLTSLSAVHGLSAFITSGLFVGADATQELITALGERVYATLLQGLEVTAP